MSIRPSKTRATTDYEKYIPYTLSLFCHKKYKNDTQKSIIQFYMYKEFLRLRHNFKKRYLGLQQLTVNCYNCQVF